MDSDRGYRLTGRTLEGRYLVEQPIARGGMGAVYKARDLRLNRLVAVKSMHLQEARKEDSVRRFDREARIAASLSHPNVVNVFDQSHDHDDIPFLVMEYMDGITLRHMIERQKRLTTTQAIKISQAVLSGLAAAHNAGFVHRDVKPENVLIADDGRIKIGDFGLTRGASNNTTANAEVMATIPYMSPELIKGETAGTASDIYSFGIMLYEMLTGVQPYRGEVAAQVTYKHLNESVPKPSLISSEATPELDEIVRITTARDPQQRPATAAAVLAHMRALLSGDAAVTKRFDTIDTNKTALLSDTAAATTRLDTQSTTATTTMLTGNAAGFATGATDTTAASSANNMAMQKAQEATARRAKKGKTAAITVAAAAALAGGAAWWFMQGPGALRQIPDLTEAPIEQAHAQLIDAGFEIEDTECTSPSVDPGLVVQTTPAAGKRAQPGSSVEVCVSIGPEMLAVPQLVGLTLDEAETATKQAGFTVGKIVRETFDDQVSGTVSAALGENGEALGDSYPEQRRVDFVVSAGSIPNVSGLSLADAIKTLHSARITAHEGEAVTEHSREIAKGKVIRIETGDAAVNVGDTVTLVVSEGPELHEVPNVLGKRISEAMQILEDAGFTPKTAVPQLLRNAVRVKDTDPEPGAQVPLGSEINLGFEL